MRGETTDGRRTTFIHLQKKFNNDKDNDHDCTIVQMLGESLTA
jgi:hypothetical protein